MNPIEIKGSKKKIIFAILGCLVFVALGCATFFFYPPSHPRFSFSVFIGILAIVTFGTGILLLIRRLIIGLDSLIIDQQGILLSSKLLLRWHDIVGFRTIKIHSVKLIIIDVVDSDSYINNFNTLQSFLAIKTQQLYGSPFTIAAQNFTCKFSFLERVLHDKLNEYRESSCSKLSS